MKCSLWSRIFLTLTVLLISNLSFGAIVTPAPIPSNQVNLSDYGGVPGAAPSTLVSAFGQAFSRLKSLGGGTLYIAPGTYNFGSASSAVTMISVSDLANVAISGYGTTFTMTTTAQVMPVMFSFVNPTNVTVAGLTFTDPGTDVTVNWKGMVCISVDTNRNVSKFKTIDIVADKVLTFFRSQPALKWSGTEFDINGTVRNAYYGVNPNFTGRYSKMNVTVSNTRRAFIGYGARDWDITVNGSSTGAIGSNAYIELAPTDGAPIENVNVDLTYSGTVSPYGGLVHFYQQGTVSADSAWIRNVKANVTLNNITGSNPGIFLFSHDPGTGYLSTTPRAFENITLSGLVNGSFGTTMIGNITTSTNASSVVYVTQSMAQYQNMATLPAYFKVITDSTTPTTTTTTLPSTTVTTTTLPPSSGGVTNLTITSDATNVTMRYSFSGSPTYLRMYLDTDRNAATGYSLAGIGADYLIENGTLYKYSGTGGAWGWSSPQNSNMVRATSSVSWSVSRASLGSPAAVNAIANTDNDVYSSIYTQTLSSSSTPTTTTTTVPSSSTVTWTRCATEGGVCSFTGTRQVRYGANGAFAYKTATGSIACDNATFGDPAYGFTKYCDYSSQVLVSDPTTTTTTTLPATAGVSNLAIASDATNVSISYSFSGSPTYLRMFLDTDRSATTGYSLAGIGADYLIENGTLYKYSGTGGAWGWSSPQNSNMVRATSSVKWTVSRSSLGSPSGLNAIANTDNDVYSVVFSAALSTSTSAPAPSTVGTVIDMSQVNPELGYAYIIYKDFGTAGDTSTYPTQSKLQIYENGIALGPAHSLHVDIRNLGQGRFSHWGNSLRFSSSDRTNPKTNGRTYSYKILP